MKEDEYLKANELHDLIKFNEGKIERLKYHLDNFKRQENRHILKFDLSAYEIMVYSDDVVRCMENEIIRLEYFINDLKDEFNKL